MKRLAAAATLVALAAGCSLRPPARTQPSLFDLGAPAAATDLPQVPLSLAVHEPAAPSWLQFPAMHYRLAAEQGARLHTFALSRWAAPPTHLVSRRVLARLAEVCAKGAVAADTGADTDVGLWIDLEEFGQVVDEAADTSRVVVRLRATLTADAGRRLLGQQAFAAEETGLRADAPAGVEGLRQALDRVSVDLGRWVGEVAAKSPPEPAPAH